MKGYIKVLGVAYVSLEELLEDYRDFLRQGSSQFNFLTLGHQASFLLSRQIKSLEEKFIKEGGYTERLFRRRLNERGKSGTIGKWL